MDQKTDTNSIFIFIFGFLLGVAVSSFVFIMPLISIFILLVGLAMPVAEKIGHRVINKEVLFLSLAFLSFALGALRYSIKDFHEPLVLISNGLVASEPERGENTTRFILRTDNGERILVNTDLYSPVAYGDRVTVEGKLNEPGIIDDGINRPFDYAAYLAKDDIYRTFIFASVKIISHGGGNLVRTILIKVKEGYIGKIEEILPEPEAGLLAGFTIAGKSALPGDVLEQFRRAGVIHVVVLSGFHVALVTLFLFWFFSRFFFRLHLGPKPARLAAVSGLVVFVLMAGASASILRAAVMALIAVGGKFLNRRYSASRALLAAVFLLTLFNPKILIFDVSFHLSFLATAGIICLAPIIDGYLSKIFPSKWGLRNLLSITLAAQIAVSPYLLYSMGNVSLIALLANVLILPVVPFVMAIGFLATLLAYLSPLMALPFSYVAHLLLAWILLVANRLGHWPHALLLLPNFPFWAAAILYIPIVLLVIRRRNFVPLPAN